MLQNENNGLKALSGERMKLRRHLTSISRDIESTHRRYDQTRVEIKRYGNMKSNLIRIKEKCAAERKTQSRILEKLVSTKYQLLKFDKICRINVGLTVDIRH